MVHMLHAVVPLPEGLAAAIGAETGAPQGAVMMWPLRQIRRREEVTRDQLPGARSLQRGASLLALLGEPPRHASLRSLIHHRLPLDSFPLDGTQRYRVFTQLQGRHWATCCFACCFGKHALWSLWG